ncbi:hypothetical protein H632_c3046p0, partial [Helicosporidium sp. ATCC 50920]
MIDYARDTYEVTESRDAAWDGVYGCMVA